jgi:hypothetical protein
MVAKDFQSTCKIILQSPPSSFPARCLHKMSFVPKLGSQIWYSTSVRSRYTPKQENSQEETLNARIPGTKQEAKHECLSDTNCREYSAIFKLTSCSCKIPRSKAGSSHEFFLTKIAENPISAIFKLTSCSCKIPRSKQEAQHEFFSDTNCRESYVSNLQN